VLSLLAAPPLPPAPQLRDAPRPRVGGPPVLLLLAAVRGEDARDPILVPAAATDDALPAEV
jgi:hypothetical protein